MSVIKVVELVGQSTGAEELSLKQRGGCHTIRHQWGGGSQLDR